MFGEIHWRFEENMFGDLEKKCSAIWRKRVRQFGENVFGAIMAISYWSSLWNSIELGDRKRTLNHNGEKVRQVMETKTLFIIKWRVHIWGILRIETYEVLDVP